MPRPKPKQAEPVFPVCPHSLNEGEKAHLLVLLGYREYDPNNTEFDPLAGTMRHQMPGYAVVGRHVRVGPLALIDRVGPLVIDRDPNAPWPWPKTDPYLAIWDVEEALGLYIANVRQLDNIPRPADYRETFRPVRRAARNLLNALSGLTGYYRDQLKIKRIDIDAFETSLTSLTEVSDAVVKEFKGKSSKGARRNTALSIVVNDLQTIFQRYYTGQRDSRKQQGAFQYLADWERHEREFVGTALRYARIIRDGDRRLPRLIRNARCPQVEEPRKG